MRVPEYLSDQNVPFESVIHAPAYSAQKLAKALHVPGRHVVKSVMLVGQGNFLAVLPAPCQVNLQAVSARLGQEVQLANEDQVAERFCDCERGSLTPFGRLYGVTTLLEESIPLDAMIHFEAQRHFLAIRMVCRDFVRLEQPLRFAFSLPQATRPQAS